MHPDPVRNEVESEAAAIRLTGRGLNMRSLPAQQRASDTHLLSTRHWMNQAQNNSAAQSDGLEGIAGAQYVILKGVHYMYYS